MWTGLVRVVGALLLTVGIGSVVLDKPGAESWTVFGALVGVSIWLVRPVFTGQLALKAASGATMEEFLKSAVPPRGAALLYVYRSGYTSAMIGFDVQVDGRSVATLKSPRYTRIVVAPGQHVVRCGPGGLAGRGNQPEDSVVQVTAGDVIILAVTTVATGVNSAKTVLVRETNPSASMLRLASMKQVPAAESQYQA